MKNIEAVKDSLAKEIRAAHLRAAERLAKIAEEAGITVDTSAASGDYGFATSDSHDGAAIAYWLDDDATTLSDRRDALDAAIAARGGKPGEEGRQSACDDMDWYACSYVACYVLAGRADELDDDELADAIAEAAEELAKAI